MKDYEVSNLYDYNEGKPFGVYISSLGHFNEGMLTGKFLYLPATKDEMIDALNTAGIDDIYEEYFISDYDDYTNLGIGEICGEYGDLQSLNQLALTIESLDDVNYEKLQAYISENKPENISELYSIANNINDSDILIYSGVTNREELAEYFIENVYEGIENCPTDIIKENIDIDKFGKDERKSFYNLDYYDSNQIKSLINSGKVNTEEDINAGLFWCNNTGATDREIGEAKLNLLDIDKSDLKDYFDYESYGKSLEKELNIIYQDNDAVDISNDVYIDDTLLDDLDYLDDDYRVPTMSELVKKSKKSKSNIHKNKHKSAIDRAKSASISSTTKNKNINMDER